MHQFFKESSTKITQSPENISQLIPEEKLQQYISETSISSVEDWIFRQEDSQRVETRAKLRIAFEFIRSHKTELGTEFDPSWATILDCLLTDNIMTVNTNNVEGAQAALAVSGQLSPEMQQHLTRQICIIKQIQENAGTQTKLNFVKMDLSRLNLNKAPLVKANLIGANLSSSSLWQADLTGALLIQTNMTGANLTGANLTNADLSHAQLPNAILVQAILVSAKLLLTNLSATNLTNANLSDALITECNFTRANLSGADLNKTRILADLTQTNFLGVRMTNTTLERSTFFETILIDVNTQQIIDLSEATIFNRDALHVYKDITISSLLSLIKNIWDSDLTSNKFLVKKILNKIIDEVEKESNMDSDISGATPLTEYESIKLYLENFRCLQSAIEIFLLEQFLEDHNIKHLYKSYINFLKAKNVTTNNLGKLESYIDNESDKKNLEALKEHFQKANPDHVFSYWVTNLKPRMERIIQETADWAEKCRKNNDDEDQYEQDSALKCRK